MGIAAAALIIALLGLGAYLIEKHDLLDEQFGDTGDWGDDEDDETLFTFNDADYISDDRVKAYMFAGTDAGGVDKGEGFNGDLADFITVLVIDDSTKKYAFFPVNRNTMVDIGIPNESGDIQNFARQQVCTAHWYGRNDEERNYNLKEAVTEAMCGLNMDGYYVINMKDIGEINDVIGGVTVDIDTDMTKLDPAFKAGATVHLKGDQAESYLRARMDVGEGTNAERMKRQQQYMQNAYTMVAGQLREDPGYINDLYVQLENKSQSEGISDNLSKIANKIVEYDNMGFINFTGETKVGDTIGEGIEHEEFYVDQMSVLDGLKKVMNIREDTSSDEDEE